MMEQSIVVLVPLVEVMGTEVLGSQGNVATLYDNTMFKCKKIIDYEDILHKR